MSFIEELRGFMEEEEVKALGISDTETFRITSRDQANYYIRKVQEMREQGQEIADTAESELKRYKDTIEAWRDKELGSIDTAVTYFVGLLREFAESELEGTKKKSIKLPFGALAFRAQADKFIYDEDILKKFLEENATNYLNHKQVTSINKTELKKDGVAVDGKFVVNGQVVEGIKIEPQDVKFEVK